MKKLAVTGVLAVLLVLSVLFYRNTYVKVAQAISSQANTTAEL